MDARTSHTMMLLMAGAMSEEQIVIKMQEAIDKWKANPSKETFSSIAFYGVLVGQKIHLGEGTAEDIAREAEDFDKVVKAHDMFKPNGN